MPQTIYTDRKNVYIHKEHHHKLSVFGEMCERLGIALIPAYSPQAKGRIERSNGVHQDRLVKKMALQAASAEDAHREKPAKLKLADVCYKISTRKIMNDWTVSYKNMTLQISKQSSYPPSKINITVREILDGQIELYYRDRKVQNYSK